MGFVEGFAGFDVVEEGGESFVEGVGEEGEEEAGDVRGGVDVGRLFFQGLFVAADGASAADVVCGH